MVDRQYVLVSNLPAGNVAAAMAAMPALGTSTSEFPGVPLFSKSVVSMVDGSKVIGQTTYDNRGNGGWFTGQLRKSSSVLPQFDDNFEVRKYYDIRAGQVTLQGCERGVYKRIRTDRVETRLIRDSQGTGNILNAIYSQLGHGWFVDGMNFVFLGGSINDSGANQNEWRVDYRFVAYGGVPADPLGPGSLPIPELDLSYRYQYIPAVDTTRVASVIAVPMWDENQVIFRLPGL